MGNNYSVLGICYGGHDTSAALVNNNKIVAACEQERFDLIKHSRSFPHEAINECLKLAGIELSKVNEISIGDDLIDLINDNAQVKIIYKNKEENEIMLIFNEILNEIKKVDLQKKIESLEAKVSLNLDESLYSELLSLRNQLKGG